MTPLQLALRQLVDHHDLTSTEATAAFEAIMDGHAADVETAAFLAALRVKGESATELLGLASAMRARLTPIPTTRTGLLDTCGTGGDELHTFNISTATALVVAACGVPVAKHGNRSVSSSSGSADVLEHLGVNVTLSAAEVGRCIDTLGIGFCFAPLLHTAMKHVAPVRKQLGIRTIFNLAGPLTNPARAEFQLVGTYRPETARLLAEVLLRLGTRRAVVVCGGGQLDEVALWGETTAWIIEENDIRNELWTADQFGLPGCRAEDLRVTSPAESAATIRRVLSGERCAARDMVLANAATALWIAGHAPTRLAGVTLAAAAIDSGEVAALLTRLAHATQTAALAP
jgi:anthranilate phosphoribosyltransferase